ncbi:hypothetical protein [Pararhodobacter oceanensis]|uniref:hypothetical protein n=1 Tax=Pararhodobacter oceanensis TaxID=2172121 RepID=UPI003A8FDC64
MRLRVNGVIETGIAELDNGITDLQVAVFDGAVHVYSTTGRNGGVAGYTLGANGDLRLDTTVIFPTEITGVVSDRLVFGADGSGPMLYLGSDSNGLIGYSLGVGASSSSLRMGWDTVQSLASTGSTAATEALITLADQSPDLFPAAVDLTQIVDLISMRVDGQDFMLTLCTDSNRITAYQLDTGNNQMVEAGAIGALEGLGIAAPTAMECAQINGQTYVLVAAAGTSSISVLQLGPDGALLPTDHLLDNGTTRFAGVQDLAVAQSGDHVFVVAGGADNGISLFMLMPDGTLVHQQTIADSAATSMHTVTALSISIEGDLLHVFAGSQNDAGISQFTMDLSNLGGLEMGTDAAEILNGSSGDDIVFAVGQGDRLRAGAGDDVLVAGDGQTQMTGGAGSDTFVFREGSGTSDVLDFERAFDRLDLTALPMLRDISQLSITTTATGARIDYRGHTIFVTSADGEPLSADDLFPDGLIGGDHIPYISSEQPPAGVEMDGSLGSDALVGTAYNDVINGLKGKDTISGGAGDDYLSGGGSKDRLDGGDGNDTLMGGNGRDFLVGGSGNDWIDGEGGRDRIYTGHGDKRVYGGEGHDSIYAGDGNDLIDGGTGNDKIYSGSGNDTVFSGGGADSIYAGEGDDLVSVEGGAGVVYLGPGRDSVTGSEFGDLLVGMQDDDTLDGGGGNDTLIGGKGEDLILGGDGHDLLNGKNDDDTIYSGTGNDHIIAGTGQDLAYGGTGNDIINGGRGHDTLYGEDGGDGIWGGKGHDVIDGGNGNDWLSGESGNDTIYGGSGNDTIRGGSGFDEIWGGAGADVFEFYGDHETGLIMDFDTSQGDILRLEDAMWLWQGEMSAAEVVSVFGSLDDAGNVVLDFTDVGGSVIVLTGFNDLQGLHNNIEFM